MYLSVFAADAFRTCSSVYAKKKKNQVSPTDLLKLIQKTPQTNKYLRKILLKARAGLTVNAWKVLRAVTLRSSRNTLTDKPRESARPGEASDD